MHGCVEQLLVAGGSLLHRLLSSDLDGRLPEREWPFKASVLLHTVRSDTIVHANSLPVTVRNLLVERSDTSGQVLRQPDSELNVRRTFFTLLKLTDSVHTLQLGVDTLQPVLTHEARIVRSRVVQCADESHSLGHLLFHLCFKSPPQG